MAQGTGEKYGCEPMVIMKIFKKHDDICRELCNTYIVYYRKKWKNVCVVEVRKGHFYPHIICDTIYCILNKSQIIY